MRYNEENRLDRVIQNANVTIYYQYDGAGQRVRKTLKNSQGTIVETRKYVGGWEVYERKAAGVVDYRREPLHVMDDKERVALVETKLSSGGAVQDQLVRHQYSNHLGTATLELDHTGAIISYEEYYPFGSTSFQSGRTATEVSLKRYRYTGKERDEESGFYYHGARYYIPWLCRWAAVDPLEQQYSPWSSYNYGFNNPVKWTDSTGMGPDGKEPVPVGFKSGKGTEGKPIELQEVEVKAEHPSVELQEVIITAKRTQEKKTDQSELGSLSEQYETGGRGPGTVSSGMVGKGKDRRPDPGGVSYGSYQFTSKTRQKDGSYRIGGRVQEFINSPEGSSWKEQFAGLIPGSKEFSAMWEEIALTSPETFKQAQHDFIQRTHYNIAKATLSKIGLDIDNRSPALRDVVWSTSVQHGPGNKVFQNALSGKNISELSDEQIIRAVYSERGAKKGDALKYFSWANTQAAQAPLLVRFKKEMGDALRRLSQ